MSTTNGKLKYLWTAYYADGELKQPEDDKSKDHDDKAEWNPSSFRDIDQDAVEQFYITGDGKEFGVDLRTGEFIVNGEPFVLEDQNLELSEPRKLIYFREVRQEWVDGVPQEPYVNRYFIGWQAKDKNGKNHKYTIGVG